MSLVNLVQRLCSLRLNVDDAACLLSGCSSRETGVCCAYLSAEPSVETNQNGAGSADDDENEDDDDGEETTR